MGLAERFRKKLEQNDIVEKINHDVQENVEQEKDTSVVKLVSVPIPDNNERKFEDLETDIISKIRKTPYWKEYSTNAQENMISKYFESKLSRPQYSKIDYTISEKLNFVRNILDLVNDI